MHNQPAATQRDRAHWFSRPLEKANARRSQTATASVIDLRLFNTSSGKLSERGECYARRVSEPSDRHGVMFQFFEWNLPNDGQLWNALAAAVPHLRDHGVTAVWFPPCYKGQAGSSDVGYGAYDLYDLGEFDQKGSVRTKYGTRDELLHAIDVVQSNGIDAYLDLVMNHRMGGDETEEVEVIEVDPTNRLVELGTTYVIRAWSRYTFPRRGRVHSDFEWNREHFTAFGADANRADLTGRVFRVHRHSFSFDVDEENGNFDYLMGADVHHGREDVRDELVRWGTWILDTTKARGVRIDAAKHMSFAFIKEWLERVRATRAGEELFAVAEYWSGSIDALEAFLTKTGGAMRLFDVPLHFHFREASERGRDYDLRALFDDTLVGRNPIVAVTFVDNHDSQPGQALSSPVADWFKPIAYAFILLRKEGYPCIFYGDYFGNDGSGGEDQRLISHRVVIDAMLTARTAYLYGDQQDHFETSTCVGWLLTGNEVHPGIMAVVISTAEAASITMQTHRPGLELRDVTGAHPDPVRVRDDGSVELWAQPGGVSVWCST